jgi:DNA-directed RNA polymerase specialized sigma24 family protein
MHDFERQLETSEFRRTGVTPTDALPEQRDFIQALGRCTQQLRMRDRRVWFMRVFYDLSTKEISSHPEIGLSPNHVDVVLHRSRQLIRDCMQGKGHRVCELPAGSFLAVWKSFRGPRASERVGTNEHRLDVVT